MGDPLCLNGKDCLPCIFSVTFMWRITIIFPVGRIAAAFPVGRIAAAFPIRGVAIAFFRETIHCARDELAYLPFWKILGRIKFVELYWPADSIEDPMNFHLMGHKAYDLDLSTTF